MTLEERLIRVEDELTIRNIIAKYGLAADCGDVDIALSCHTEDALYVVSDPNAGRGKQSNDLELKGHAAIKNMLNSDMHQSLLPKCAHTVGPLLVTLKGVTAEVIGYSRVYFEQKLMRVAVNNWTMQKDAGDWKIKRRESRVIGDECAQKLLKESLNGI